MKSFQYKVQAAEGLHARPAGLLVKCAQGCASDVTLSFQGKQANAKKLFAIMALGVKAGDTIELSANGASEVQDAKTLGDFCRENI